MKRRIHNTAGAALVGACLALFGPEPAATATVRPPQEATACTPYGASGCLAVAEPPTTDALPNDARRAGDLPAAAARRRSGKPSSSLPLTVAEPDGDGPTPDGAAPLSGRPVGEAPMPEPLPVPPAIPEPAADIAPEVGPTPPAEPAPPQTVRAQAPAPPPSGRLPATGAATGAAVAGAFLSLGGLCIGAGRHARIGR